MPLTIADPLEPQIGFHPYRAVFTLPYAVLPGASWTEDRPGEASGHAGVDALLNLTGVAVVSLREDRLTLIRDPGTAWESILRAAREVLARDFVASHAVFTPR